MDRGRSRDIKDCKKETDRFHVIDLYKSLNSNQLDRKEMLLLVLRICLISNKLGFSVNQLLGDNIKDIF